MRLSKLLLVPALAGALVLSSGGVALAKHPPPPPPAFNAASARLTPSGSLVVSFGETGLDRNAVVTEQTSAQALMTYACNGDEDDGGQVVGGLDRASGNFAADKHGNLNGELALAPLGPLGSGGCNDHRVPVLVAVSYTNVQITDATNGVTAAVPGTFTEAILPR